MAAETAMIGRDEELRTLAGFLDKAAIGPRVALVEGEAGAGKSTIFSAVLETAREGSFRTLVARPADTERELSFVALRDLVADVVDEVWTELPEPQRRALAVALLREEPTDLPPDRGAVASACLGVVRRLAAESPVLIAVDDAQWLDAATSTTLAFAARRLRDEPVGFLLARRSDVEADIVTALGAVFRDEDLDHVRLGPLSVGALHVVLRTRLGLVLPRPTQRRVHDMAGGNPFFALEIGRALQMQSEPPDPRLPLPLPDTLRALVRGRIARLSRKARSVLPAIAALARATDEALEALTSSPPGPAVDEAVAADVLSRAGDRVRFAHPLLGAHVYAELSPSQRRALHRRLAEVVADPEERARHLALGVVGRDARVAETLDAAARLALARGAPSAAAEHAEQAARLTPEEDADMSSRRLIHAARCQFQAGDTSGASLILSDALERLPLGALRAEALVASARIDLFTDELGRAVSSFEEAVDQPSPDVAIRGEAEEGLAWSFILLRRAPAEAAKRARRAASDARTLGDDEALAEAIAVQGVGEFLEGRADGLRLVERAASMTRGRQYPRVIRHPEWALALVRTWADDLEGARTGLEALLDVATSRGDESSLPRVLFALSQVHLLAGDWPQARCRADEGHEAALQDGQEPQTGLLLFSQAIVDAHFGAIGAVRAAADRAHEAKERSDADVTDMVSRIALGSLELSLGNADEADRQLRPLVVRVREAGIAEPGAIRFVPDQIEALIRSSRIDEAESLLTEHEHLARRAKRASASAACGRCRGLLLSTRGDAGGAFDALAGALAAHDRVPMPFERARTMLVLGATQRRAKQKRAARASLVEALDLFQGLGASVWADAAEGELARIGGRAPSGGLTETERRVAELAAQGLTNREVASALFVTVKTVEANLSRVYSKLHIRSRASLVRHVAGTEPGTDPWLPVDTPGHPR